MKPTPREEALAQLFALAAETELAYRCALPDGVQLKVAVHGERRLVCAWHQDGERLGSVLCEEIGEDAGFYDPRIKPWVCAESTHAHLIIDGFQGALCEHQWGVNMHFDERLQFGNLHKCELCGVTLTCASARRGNRVTYTYDVWQIRENIYQRWAKRGPVLGALQEQPYHLPTPKRKSA
ncbi:hypothetical protein ACFFLM_19235 [Deinococcus oregonensis]|uniref:Uncharacterized protein n=1 Tax=Deinococcus oregonensis TaxID=1805970 RepID=A0ABV6B2V7_9DEIO